MEFIKIGNIVLPTHFIKSVSGTPASFTVSVGFAILTNFTFEGLEGKEAFDALYNFQPHPPINLDPVIVIKSGMPMTVRSIEMLDGTVLPVSVTAGDEVIPVKDIVWIDLKAHFDDTNEFGIEVGWIRISRKKQRKALMEGEKQQADYMGQIVASRCSSGGTALYGSPILHNEMICITIKESSVRHDLGRDWYHGGKMIAEVHLSPAQWADFLTRMNMGDGVPCTVSWKNGHGVDTRKIPDPDPIKFGDSSDKELMEISKRWREVEGIIDELLVKGKAGKKDLEDLKKKCAWYRTSGQSTFKFLTETLIERAEKVTNAVKHEIAAIVEHSGIKWISRDISEKQLTEASKPKEIE